MAFCSKYYKKEDWALRTLKQILRKMREKKENVTLFVKLFFFFFLWYTMGYHSERNANRGWSCFILSPPAWMNGSLSTHGSKNSSSWCENLYFWHSGELCVCHSKQLFPCLAAVSSGHALFALPCLFLLIDRTWSNGKKEEREMLPLFIFL